jgi:hypothetical protein
MRSHRHQLCPAQDRLVTSPEADRLALVIGATVSPERSVPQHDAEVVLPDDLVDEPSARRRLSN